jgi:hypothetical protein
MVTPEMLEHIQTLSSKSVEQAPKETPEQTKKGVEAEADHRALVVFRTLSTQIIPEASHVFQKQALWQHNYEQDTDDLTMYLARDYRGTNYADFQPDTDSLLATVRSHRAFPAGSDPTDDGSPRARPTTHVCNRSSIR